MLLRNLHRHGLAVMALGMAILIAPTTGYSSGGGGGGGGGGGRSVDTIKVIKCEYAVTTSYVELLISASSSNSNALLYAYLPDGTLLGQVQNGGGGRYGGTVFLSLWVPATITIVSSYGGCITVPCTPYQP